MTKTPKLYAGLLFVSLCMAVSLLTAQNPPINRANYRLAEQFSPEKLKKMVFSTSVRPNWLETGDKFWYSYKTSEGSFYYLVDLDKRSKTPLFDNHEMARQLTLITKDPYDHQNLPVITPKFVRNDRFFQFDVTSSQDEDKKDEAKAKTDSVKTDTTRVNNRRQGNAAANARPKKKVFHLEYNLETGQLYENTEWKEEPKPKTWANVSPDSTYVLFARDYNLFWMSREDYRKALKNEEDTTIVEHRLTSEGEQFYAFGGGYTPNMNDSKKKIEEESKKRRPASAVWSPDGHRFAVTRNDSRDIKFMWVINSLSNPRPELESYKYQMPGEEDPNESELWIFDMRQQKGDTVPVAAFKNQTLSVVRKPLTHKERIQEHRPGIWLSPSSDELYFTRISRDLKRYDVCLYNISTKETRVLIEERMNTYVDVRDPYLVNGGQEIIHWSERDGWAHFYLYDKSGKLKNQITTGPWHANRILSVDERNRTLYFVANGREAGENPYYSHLYSIRLDGSNLRLLNAGDFNHDPILSDSHRFFVNNYSRVNTAPKSEIRDVRGQLVMELESADLRNLMAAGFQFPEPFTAKAADGVTDLYGVMYKPFDFDPNRSYPIIQYVYPGPQTEAVNLSFSASMDRVDRLAQIGFIVVTLGNRGGHPNRSKWYHNYGYGDLRDYGLDDKKYVAEQLAQRHSFIDIDKVGIFGHSGGGFMSTAAMLQYPDFFKVAVSSAGNHENNIYNRWWSEKHHGVKEIVNNEGEVKFLYDIETNSSLARNLKGKLLLTTGDMDNNVHPANTYRMIEALIKAQKRFDVFLMTGQRHGYGNHTEYNFWLTADYFAKHLIGDYSISTDIFEMRRETKLSPSNNSNNR